MDEKIKFTEEELNKLKTMQDKYNNTVLQMGQIDIELIKTRLELKKLEDLKSKLENDYIVLRNDEILIVKELTKKYGPGMVQPDTGEFTPGLKT